MPTIFQRLNATLGGGMSDATSAKYTRNVHNYSSLGANDVIYTTGNKEDYEKKLAQLRQQRMLARQWKRAQYNISNNSLANMTEVQMMYREADMMDLFPEVGAALDTYMEESTYCKPGGYMINVTSKSERIKNILEDLIYNRLSCNITFPMITRSTCKYGNTYMLLNITGENGITGWKQLPVYEMQRFENGMENPYSGAFATTASIDVDKTDSTKFVWVGQNEYTPYRNWQIAHFRLLYDSLYLPYGVSALNKARRHWRMLSIMEDMMLMYRLERSVERRVFKVNVGAIDEQDVPAYMDEIANNFKRTPIVDPLTGQLDLRKNILPVWKNTPIPLLDGRVITIEQLAREYENGAVNYVYSIQDGTHQVVPGKVAWCGKNYTAKQMVKVTLDDGGYVVLAPEHEFIMRDGSRKRADELQVGESVMPFYTNYEKIFYNMDSTYQTVYNPASGKYEFTHRLVANEIEKPVVEGKKINTVHHKDFNRYNNTPENLLWCNFEDHGKMHSELSRRNNLERWHNPETKNFYLEKLMEYNNSDLHKEHDKIRSVSMSNFWRNGDTERAKYRMTVHFDEYVWDKIDNAIFNGVVYNRLTMLDFINNELIDHLLEINSNKRLHNLQCISRRVLEERISECGFSSISEYINHVHEELGGVDPREIVKKRKSENMTRFNNGNKSVYVKFDEFIWSKIRLAIISRHVNCVSDIANYINTELIGALKEVNNITDTDFSVDVDTVTRRIKELGFSNTTEYIEAMRKNHKVAKIEYVDGDDVYCMTVLGLNGEEDRHNFAVYSMYDEQEQNNQYVSISGCFVANCNLDDFFVPVRDPSEPNPIETLSAGQNMTAMDDIKFVQNKLCTALRVPKTFLNFEDTAGDGKNLAMLDVRFTRTVNRVQQMMLMELNKVCIIHLYLLGFVDELTNFQLSMNNPSSQAEMLELDNLSKKIEMAKSAVADPGGGIPIMSVTRACKEILGWTDKQISDNLEELRLERALAMELQQTQAIIKRTGLFDKVDNLYGEIGAEYGNNAGGQGDGMDGGMGGGMGGGGMLGGAMDMGMDMGGDMDGDMAGAEGEMDMGDAAAMEGADMGGGDLGGGADMGGDNSGEAAPLTEGSFADRLFLKAVEDVKRTKGSARSVIMERLAERGLEDVVVNRVPIYQKNFFVNEELDSIAKALDAKLKKKDMVTD